LLSYWIESGCNSANTKIWVKVPSIPGNSAKTIYAYYGNPNATSQSNGYSTFQAFNLKWDGPISGRTSIGGWHTCTLLSNGSVKCWGENYNWELGDGRGYPIENYSSTPVTVKNLTNAVAVAAGKLWTCALLSNNSVKCWGDNYYGVLGDGKGYPEENHSSTPVTVKNLTSAVAVAAGNSHTCALLSNGSVECWGGNDKGQLGDGTTINRRIPVKVRGITNAIAISLGVAHTCALLSNGSIKCWGYNFFGQLGDGKRFPIENYSSTPVTVKNLTNAVAVAAGEEHTCALLSNGSVECWGDNVYGQLGNGTSGLLEERSTPVEVANLTNVIAISAGAYFTCALLNNGGVKCWGYNHDGQLGDGTTINRNTPVKVTGVTNAVEIGSSEDHSCVLLKDGSIKCWGINLEGQLGNGTTRRSFTPVTVLNYNIGGEYDKTNGIFTIHRSPQIDTYFIRAYTSSEPTTSVGAEQSINSLE
jgi:alpha-tubulin suppressor-like RCC1 family protein